MLRKRSIEPEESTECAQRGQASCGQKLSPCGCRLPFSILKTVLQNAEQRGGFTLAELMIVIGAIGILSGIVITAVNPQHQLVIANNAKRKAATREIQRAVQQFIINRPEQAPALIAEIQAAMGPSGKAARICAPGWSTGCADLTEVEEYLSLPLDVAEPDPTRYTGFKIAITEKGQVSTEAQYLDEEDGSDSPVMPQPVDDVTQAQIYWYDGDIWRRNLDGTEEAHIVIENVAPLSNIIVEPTSKKIYWADSSGIKRANLNGTDPETLSSTVNNLAAVDPECEQLYYGNQRALWRMDFDGGNEENIGISAENAVFDFDDGHIYSLGGAGPITTGYTWIEKADLFGCSSFLPRPTWSYIEYDYSETKNFYGLNFDPSREYVYFIVSDMGTSDMVRWHDDGTGQEVLASDFLFSPTGRFQVDENNTTLFWIMEDSDTAYLYRTSLSDAEHLEAIKIFGMYDNPRDLTIDSANDRLIWTENFDGQGADIFRADLNAQNEVEFVPGAAVFALYFP